jgi:hypothetical protein
MMTWIRSLSRKLAIPALGLILACAVFTSEASAQAQKEERVKEPTDDFFSVPDRPDSEKAEAWGLPAYLVTSTLAFGAVFVLCRSARRSYSS